MLNILKLVFVLCFAGNTLQAKEAPLSEADRAKKIVEEVAHGFIKILSQNTPQSVQEDQIRAVIEKHFDLFSITQFVSAPGAVRGKITRKRFIEIQARYTTYIVENYTQQLRDYYKGNQTFKVTKVLERGPGRYLVQSQVLVPDRAEPFEVEWSVYKVGESLKVLDVIIERVSQSQAHRNEFSSILMRKGYDGFYDDLGQRIEAFNVRQGQVKKN